MVKIVDKSAGEQLLSTCASKHRLPDEMRPYCWKPGQSGNIKGRPKGASFTDIARQILGEPVNPDEPDGPDKLDRLTRGVINAAVDGNPAALKELLARIDPAPNHNININNNVSTVNDDMFGFLEKVKAYTHSLEVEEVAALEEGINDSPTKDS